MTGIVRRDSGEEMMKLYFGNAVNTATPIAKTQHMREIWFFILSGGVLLKIAVMEVLRRNIRM